MAPTRPSSFGRSPGADSLTLAVTGGPSAPASALPAPPASAGSDPTAELVAWRLYTTCRIGARSSLAADGTTGDYAWDYGDGPDPAGPDPAEPESPRRAPAGSGQEPAAVTHRGPCPPAERTGP